MKTFAEIRKYAIEQYSRIAEKQAEVDAAYEKMAGMKIYTPEYLTKIKKAGEAEVAAVRADAAANLEAVVKLTLAEKKTALEKMLATAPSTEQTNLLNTLQVQGNRITPDEIKSIAVQLSGNYRALHALQAIAKEAGHGLQLPVQSDYQELTEALKWTEKYLYTAIDDMKNTTHYRQMNFDSRCFFDVYGGGDDGTHDDLNYKTAAIDILDGNTQTTPTVEPRTLSDQEKTIVESLFSDGTPVGDAMTQIMNSPELKTLVSLHPKYKALFN